MIKVVQLSGNWKCLTHICVCRVFIYLEYFVSLLHRHACNTLHSVSASTDMFLNIFRWESIPFSSGVGHGGQESLCHGHRRRDFLLHHRPHPVPFLHQGQVMILSYLTVQNKSKTVFSVCNKCPVLVLIGRSALSWSPSERRMRMWPEKDRGSYAEVDRLISLSSNSSLRSVFLSRSNYCISADVQFFNNIAYSAGL